MYRLHCFAQSGNSFKVALMLRLLHQPWEPVFVDYMSGATRDPAWRDQANEMGEAPVLDDGPRRLSQSGAILTYLARKHGAFGGTGEDGQLEVLRWLLFDNHKFTSFFATYRWMKSFAPTAPDPVILAFLKGRIDGAFGIADKHLATRKFMVGDSPTIADISMCAYLCYPKEESGYELPAQFPHLAGWLARVQALEGYAPPYEVLPGERILPKW
ncbi:MAG: glutathione S-transferase family protein [Ramlibacter sp.]|nr:glutathione S-transferase [Ramlibacter sp.]